MRTIRQQLLIGLLCATLACTLGAGAMLHSALLIETNELADLQLRQLAAALPDEFAPNTALPAAEDPEEEFVIQAWDPEGRLVYASQPQPPTPRYALRGFGVVQLKGVHWRVYGELRHDRYVQVSQPIAVRDALAATMAWRAGAPLLLFVAVLVVLALLVVGRAMSPLDRLARVVAERSPTAVEPLSTERWPAELSPIVQALNLLLARFGDAMAAQRTFVADAAHELRSPLTALKLQLQLVERAGSDEARALAVAKLHERLDRSSHLVKQLLSLARYEAGNLAAQRSQVDLSELLKAAVADHSTLAASRDIDLGADAPVPVTVHADPDGLRVLLNNLIDNALRYTQQGGRIDVGAAYEGGCAVLRVKDNGPGVPAQYYERLFDRFFRPDGNAVWGCGLGLSIVRSIASDHQAEIELGEGDAGRGLSVTVRFSRQGAGHPSA
ncbi:MAG: ATP-binding protein [Pseudomonadota bacterium]